MLHQALGTSSLLPIPFTRPNEQPKIARHLRKASMGEMASCLPAAVLPSPIGGGLFCWAHMQPEFRYLLAFLEAGYSQKKRFWKTSLSMRVTGTYSQPPLFSPAAWSLEATILKHEAQSVALQMGIQEDGRMLSI